MEEPLMMQGCKPSVPVATYRLQFQQAFPLSAGHELADYLHALGVSHLYSSPLMTCNQGSTHGYDIVEHGQINPEVGGLESLEQLVTALQARGMGMILDVVPNHMCVSSGCNQWWQDLLENGPSSRYANYFDVDWDPPKAELRNKVLLPQLGEQFGKVLESGDLKVVFDQGSFSLSLYHKAFPLAPRSWILPLKKVASDFSGALGENHRDVLELASILTALDHLPLQTETDIEKRTERRREKEIIKRRLSALTETNSLFHEMLQKYLERLNGRVGDPSSFDDLEDLIRSQAYRLSYWRVAADEINYRRFFDINDLAALRVEDPEVFADTHRLALELIRRGWVSGLRIDHPDGLFEPREYFHRLQESYRQMGLPGTSCAQTETCLSGALSGKSKRPVRSLFVVAEKILVGKEDLNPLWEIEGTTGYGFLNFLNGIFVDTSQRKTFQRLYRHVTGVTTHFHNLLYECKRLILKVSMSSELNVLARRLARLAEQHRWSRDFTLESVRDALAEIVACFPVYRTYIGLHDKEVNPADQAHIHRAVEAARRRSPATSATVFDFVQDVLLLRNPPRLTAEQQMDRRMFIMRLQQFTGPVMAKGMEDTAFYRYYPLLSLNEVGGNPEQFGISIFHFHRKNRIRLMEWPHALLSTSTHDTKRSEDVRARINALSEIPQIWLEKIRSWQKINRIHKTRAGSENAPDANEEYLIYQTMLGIWPFEINNPAFREVLRQRTTDFMMKAMREAKIHTSWINPQSSYEEAVSRFIGEILAAERGNPFPQDFADFAGPLIAAGWANSLSQVLLKITSPGIPDFYQGSESWNFTLVDPDNRRIVDFNAIRDLQAQLSRLSHLSKPDRLKRLARSPEDGAVKLFLTREALQFRKAHHQLFLYGEYLPLHARGPKHRHVVAFARRRGKELVLIVCGRFFLSLQGESPLQPGAAAWEGTYLSLRRNWSATQWQDLFSDNLVSSHWKDKQPVLPLDQVLAEFPVALLRLKTGW